MNTNISRDPMTEEVWRSYLTTGRPPNGVDLAWFESPLFRLFARRLPTDPRCQVCYYPFSGIGGKLVRFFLRLERSRMNPRLCNVCERFANDHPGGAELGAAFLFADIRGSTPLAETMHPHEFSQLIDRFYQVTTSIVYEHGGMVEKLVGDEITAFFVPAFTRNHDYSRAAVEAGQAMLQATGHGTAEGPWVPIGIGIHSGEAFIGAVGEPGRNIRIAVLGDNVNIAARFAGQAKAGEIVFSDVTRREAGLDEAGLESRSLSLKGKAKPIDSWVFRAGRA